MQSFILNKPAKFDAKLFTRFRDITFFVPGCFFLNHPVHRVPRKKISILMHNFNESGYIMAIFGIRHRDD